MMTIQEDFSAHARKKDANGKTITAEIGYIVRSDSSVAEDSVLDAVLDYAKSNTPSIGDMNIASVEITERFDDKNYKANVIYERNDLTIAYNKQSSEATISFDCGGGSKHLNVAYDQRKVFGTKDAGDLIGWNGQTGADQEIKGVDVPCGQLRETYTKAMRMSALTTAYKKKVAQMVGKVNSATFKGWEKGSCMFLGCSFSGHTGETVVVTFNFAIQLGETVNMTDVPQFSKDGWEYLWVIPETKIHNGVPVSLPSSVFVAKIAEEEDFSSLGI